MDKLLEQQIATGYELKDKFESSRNESNFTDASYEETRWNDFCRTIIQKYLTDGILSEFDNCAGNIEAIIIGYSRTLPEKIQSKSNILNLKINKLKSIKERLPILIQKPSQEVSLQQKLESKLQDKISKGNELLSKSKTAQSHLEVKNLGYERDRWFDFCKKLILKIDRQTNQNDYVEFENTKAYPYLTANISEEEEFYRLSEHLSKDIELKTNKLISIQESLELAFVQIDQPSSNIDLTDIEINQAEADYYDVALSFAGEDREYVKSVADYLRENDISVFYDAYEETNLWGKDLVQHLHIVYSKKAKYCIPFISKHYKEKMWTKHEFRSALERALKENKEYILPARFDDTELDGLSGTIGYIELGKYTLEEFSEIIIKKVKGT